MMHVNNMKKSYMKQNYANFPQDTVYIHEINVNSEQYKNLNIHLLRKKVQRSYCRTVLYFYGSLSQKNKPNNITSNYSCINFESK